MIDRNRSPLKISRRVAVGIVRGSQKNFRALIYGASRGHLCDSSAFLFTNVVNMRDRCSAVMWLVQWCQRRRKSVVRLVRWRCRWSPVLTSTSTWPVWSLRRRAAGHWIRRGLCALLPVKLSTSICWTFKRRHTQHQALSTKYHESVRFEAPCCLIERKSSKKICKICLSSSLQSSFLCFTVGLLFLPVFSTLSFLPVRPLPRSQSPKVKRQNCAVWEIILSFPIPALSASVLSNRNWIWCISSVPIEYKDVSL